ncbi:MAG TPA: RecX family transcriptional regulator [Methylophilaceae bacterium]|nr:RecX family transcriptional regulator [Methylophilaceae bacterium]
MTQQTDQEKFSPGKSSKHKPSLREKALAYLARREHSYQELKRKLRAHVPTAQDDLEVDLEAHYEAVDALLEDFKKRGWLSEERFTEQIIHARQRKFGSMKIAHELRENGIDEVLVEKAVAEVKDNDYANALSIYRKKYHAAPANREEWAKQARFLQGRGFGFDVIKKVLSTQQESLDE